MQRATWKLGLRLLLSAAVIAMPAVAWACPTCKDGINNDPNGANIVSGYFWSIVFMMLAPYTIFMLLGGYLYYEVRKARRAAAAAKTQAASANVAPAAELALAPAFAETGNPADLAGACGGQRDRATSHQHGAV